MNVGTEAAPFTNSVEFRLHGNNESPSEFSLDSNVPVSNKNFIVTGTLNMFGEKRTRLTRLVESAKPGDTEIKVDKDAGLVYR